MLYKDMRSIENGCFSCKALSHTFKNCPLIHLVPDRELVLKRHLNNKPHLHRTHFTRRKKIPFQTLYNYRRLEVLRLKLIDLFLFSSGSFSNYDKLLQSSVDWFGNSRISEDVSAESASSSSVIRSDLTSSWAKGKESLLESSLRKSDRKGGGVGLKEPFDEDINDRERDKEKFDPDIILRSLKLSREYKPAIETGQGHVMDDAENTLKTVSGFNMKQKDIETDRMYNFKVYFPHNNCERVISYITKRRRKILKKRSHSHKTKQKRRRNDQSISISFRVREKSQQPNSYARENFLPIPYKNRVAKSQKLVHFQKENFF